eukprot:TRINITY_DN1816_c0_g1_i1.p1 TRINITY_DN1816_c0_g1~~TRINITY_DN1816_c0_g1_i1.p1  ORF type:complete len:261 (+),score=51.12 TRINITY_DN1816_c0_g1_i1:70-852(+)
MHNLDVSPAPSAHSSSSATSRWITYSPKQLFFPPPLDSVITNILTISNTSPSCVAWKLWTTSRHRFHVSPVQGFLNPSSSAEVTIAYKPRHERDGGKESPTDLQNEVFQIEARIVNMSDENKVTEVFKRDVASDQKIKYKIKCIFGPKSKSADKSPSWSSARAMSSPIKTFGENPLPGSQDEIAMLLAERSSMDKDVKVVRKEIMNEKEKNRQLLNSLSKAEASAAPDLGVPLPLAGAAWLAAFLAARVLTHMSDAYIPC